MNVDNKWKISGLNVDNDGMCTKTGYTFRFWYLSGELGLAEKQTGTSFTQSQVPSTVFN